MYLNLNKFLSVTLLLLLILLYSCKQNPKSTGYEAYFGGEVTNPTSEYVLFCKNSKVIDSVKLDKKNRFFMKFDSLTPGLYSFKNNPEYQYVYFDKNDSIMVHINAKDFDNSVVFCGRGDQKNNFLMDLYLRNEEDKNTMFPIFEYDIDKFNTNIDSIYNQNKTFYKSYKDEIKWSDGFELYAKSALDFQYFSKKEIYPKVHQIRTGIDIYEKLPKNYYNFRNTIDFDNIKLSDFSPFIMYVSNMLNNCSTITYHNHLTEVDLALKTNVNKLNIADTLIKNENLKNKILNNIAFTYLLEDQNMVNNKLFLDTYRKYSTDKSQKNEILKIGNSIQLMNTGNALPEVKLINLEGNEISSNDFQKKKTVIFFWTKNLTSHLEAAHKKLLALKIKYPEYQIIAVNLDDDQTKWIQTLSTYKFNGINELRCKNFEDLKSKWVITKVHRTIILDKNKSIKNAFTNIFDVKFENEL
jgi:peroxiredoxin